MNRLLQGLRIVEGSAFVAAPSAGMTLAQMGADVIRFDPIGGGLDATRWPVTQAGTSLYWQGLNKGKRSVALDIRRPEGRELAVRLITAPGPDAGLFLTNFPATGWLAYDALRQRRDDLVMLNIVGNPDGSSAVDYTVNPATGLPYLTGSGGEDAPVNHVLPAWDLICGGLAVTGLLAAERHRRLTGAGQYVRLSLADTAFAAMGHLGFIAEAQVNRTERHAVGNDLYGAFGSDFLTRDGVRVMVVAITARMWQSVEQATGLADAFRAIESRLGVDLAKEGDRYRVMSDLKALVGDWCRARDFAEVQAAFEKAGVLYSRYQSLTEGLAADARLSAANPLFAEVEHPDTGRYLTPGVPLDFGASPREAPRRAPRLGEHTDEVLAEVLRLDGAEIARLHDAGVVAGPPGR